MTSERINRFVDYLKCQYSISIEEIDCLKHLVRDLEDDKKEVSTLCKNVLITFEAATGDNLYISDREKDLLNE